MSLGTACQQCHMYRSLSFFSTLSLSLSRLYLYDLLLLAHAAIVSSEREGGGIYVDLQLRVQHANVQKSDLLI